MRDPNTQPLTFFEEQVLNYHRPNMTTEQIIHLIAQMKTNREDIMGIHRMGAYLLPGYVTHKEQSK